MPFDKVDTQVDFPAQEREILALWQRINAFERLREKNRGKPKWSFLDGPITANNPMGVHHAWGRTYKDAAQRYFAMTGHELRYQNGFDCQGLWVEVEVEKELKLQSKRDIENLVPGDRFASIDKFVQACKARVDKYAKIQTEQSIRLGYWMDWDKAEDWQKPPDQRRSYFTMSEENNYTIWSFLKKCHDRGLIYRGYDAMPWCPRCGVGISQMEMHEDYQLVAHRAPFVAFPLRNRPKENLLVWTTTPWTLTSNVAAAVNPELRYLKVRLRDQFYYLAKGAFTANRLEEDFKQKEYKQFQRLKTLEQIFKEKAGKEGYEIVGELAGADMIGWQYDGPFDELPAQAAPSGYPTEVAEAAKRQGWASEAGARQIHRVIAWKDVGEKEGTGIVHIAPGCGAEDYELGKEEHLVAVAPLDEAGIFLPGFGDLQGKSAVDPATTDAILANLKQKGILLEVEKYPHNYPHCWRCKTELLFRLVDEWFINMKWRDEIVAVTEQATFLPESINGKARELDWLKNMGDWMISKKRFWGLALPIWLCDKCDHFDVLGSREELKQRAVEGWDKFAGRSPHRPWIDQVKIRCGKCGSTSSRIGDVGNPWLDAGIVPYSTMKYNTDRQYWEQWFPADFITESFPGQFRNWFYAILAMSTMMEKKPPFKVLLGHGQVRDQKGEEMHKSKGNAIPFDGAADESYELFVRRDPKVKPEEQAKRSLDKGGLPEGWQSLREGEVRIEKDTYLALFAKYPPMGADLMRWLYCRHNPASNINFGPGPADELHSKFRSKLWNSYAFFCNYARLDGFDPKAKAVAMKERPDIDRWILSDLQLLIRKAREEIEGYVRERKKYPGFNIMAFCLEAERFVDDKLSNWYIRRNRRRFWKSEKGTDKLAAYETLHTVLVTLVKLFAPIMPYLTETMYRNLVDGPNDRSVHLCGFPEVDQALIDEELSNDMEALLRLVSLGSAARNTVKIKVRQPLAEMRIQPVSGQDRRAVERFSEQITDELNIKKITLHDPSAGTLLQYEIKLNPKTLGPRYGASFSLVQKSFTSIAENDPGMMLKLKQMGSPFKLMNPGRMGDKEPESQKLPSGEEIILHPGDLIVEPKRVEGWEMVEDLGLIVALNTHITPELKNEGMAREVIRSVQNARKEANLEMEDRIILYLGADSQELRAAVEAHRAYIGSETLVKEWAKQPLDGDAYKAAVKVDGQPLTIELRKV